MSAARHKLVQLLGRIIADGEKLASIDWLSAEAVGWRERAVGALRMVSNHDAEHFDRPPIQGSFTEKWQEAQVKLLPYRLNTLRSVRERLEMFDEEDEDFLDSMRRYMELKAGVPGFLQSKSGPASTRRRS